MKTQKERMEAGDLFLPDDPEFAIMNRRNRLLVNEFNQTTVDELDKRSKLLYKIIPNIGKQAYIEPPFYCEYGEYIKTGDNFFANLDCIFMVLSKHMRQRCPIYSLTRILGVFGIKILSDMNSQNKPSENPATTSLK